MTTISETFRDPRGDEQDYAEAVHAMDDEIREELHREAEDWSPQEFVEAYADLHVEKFGEAFWPYHRDAEHEAAYLERHYQAKARTAEDLDDLLAILTEISSADRYDAESLADWVMPNFGGERPRSPDTRDVWSWNQDSVLVGDGFRFEIAAR